MVEVHVVVGQIHHSALVAIAAVAHELGANRLQARCRAAAAHRLPECCFLKPPGIVVVERSVEQARTIGEVSLAKHRDGLARLVVLQCRYGRSPVIVRNEIA